MDINKTKKSNNMHIKQLLRFVENHGFEAEYYNQKIYITIPCNDGSKEIFSCTPRLKEVKEILGY